MEQLFSVGTTFNKRLYEDEYCEIVESMQKTYPEMDFFVFHENTFEMKARNEQVEIKEEWDKLQTFDLFELNDWLFDFLKTSEFKDVHKYGKPATFDPPHYWKRNSIFWFRKVVAMNNMINLIKTPYLIWVGCDVKWIKNIDQDIIDWVKHFDVSHIDRSLFGYYTETDIIVYNFEKNAKRFIEEYLKFYLSGELFKQKRWDDCIAFDRVKDKLRNELEFGNLMKKTGAPLDIYEYLFHWKNPLFKVRDIERGI